MSYTKVRKELAEQRGEPEADAAVAPPKPCLACGTLTPHATLAVLGARCTPCYRAYCAEGSKGTAVAEQRAKFAADPRFAGWAAGSAKP